MLVRYRQSSPCFRARLRECQRKGRADAASISSQQPKNKFVETALAYALTYVCAVNPSNVTPVSITILADKDYYSNPGAHRLTSRFVDFGVPLDLAHKTGLGSSAALVAAFTVAVIQHYLPKDLIDLESNVGKARLHNLAQAAHCAAQGKVGSGFDVAAAVYGSCLYKRFSPSILEGLGDLGSSGFAQRLADVVNESTKSTAWDTEIDKASAVMPRGLKLMMCDVDCGSESVGMAKKVLQWRREKPDEASLLWATLQRGTDDLAQELQRLALSQDHGNYENLKGIILTIRSLIREMSVKSRVPVEPDVQTELLDACCRLPGVIGGVVPGAGGYDAIALLVEDEMNQAIAQKNQLQDHEARPVDQRGQHSDNDDRSQLRNLLNRYEGSASIGKVNLLNVHQEAYGIRVESSSLCDGWVTQSP